MQTVSSAASKGLPLLFWECVERMSHALVYLSVPAFASFQKNPENVTLVTDAQQGWWDEGTQPRSCFHPHRLLKPPFSCSSSSPVSLCLLFRFISGSRGFLQTQTQPVHG